MSRSRVVEFSQKLNASAAVLRAEYASLLVTIADMLEADIVHDSGYSRPSMFLAEVLWMNPRQAAQLIRHAEAIAEVRTLTGHLTPARLPVLREALLGGELDPEHVEAILRVVKKIPTWASGDTTEIVEKHLVEVAREAPPSVVAKHGELLLAHIDADGAPPKDELAAPKNAFRYRRDAAGWMHFAGSIEPESAEELDAMLGALAKPEGPSDERSTVQRLGDAFCDVVHHALDSDDLPARGGEKPHLNVTMDCTDLVQAVGTATLEGGAELSAAAVRRIACDSQIVPMVMSGTSVPLDVGRSRRLVSAKQRVALNARDKGCAFPNCDRPARWSDAHHIKSWLDGGATDLDNLVLLCRRHHRIIHHSDWAVRMTGTGVPEFVPPRWIDPLQVPRRNLLHRRE